MRRLSCIINSYESEFHSQEYILAKSAPKSIAFVMPLSLISVLDLFSTPPDELLLFFPFMDKVPKYLRSSVVYLFKCRCCSASYVGQTTPHLHAKITEQLGISPITGKHTSNPAKSSVLSHSCASAHKVDFDDFKILSCCSDSYELMIHESLLINKYKPTLDVQGSSIPLNFF